MHRRSDRSADARLDRRTFLAAAGAVTTATGIGLALGADPVPAVAQPPDPSASGAAQAASASADAAAVAGPNGAGTTLVSVAAPRGASGYRKLGDGPGWPRQVRGELAEAQRGREDRRTTLASFVQFTDLHLTDVQHPLRYEFFRAGEPGAWRP
ncbi:TIGR03767 family metallophosphoesterase, partial [Streptomyces sp. AA8]|nr:TIGR03767 family metallophosphoesterase [Streptomyces telluris]